MLSSSEQRSEQKKMGALQNCRILYYAYFGILGNLPSKKSSLPVFNFLLPPTFSMSHLPPPINGVDAPDCIVSVSTTYAKSGTTFFVKWRYFVFFDVYFIKLCFKVRNKITLICE